MEKYLWQKTLLELYGGYKTCIVSCDNKLARLVRRAFSDYTATYEQLDDMRLVVLRKKHCQHAKQLIDKAINGIKPVESSVLYWRYMRGLQFNEIAIKLDMPIRQVFRKYEKEMIYFVSALAHDGCGSSMIEIEFGEDIYFKSAYDRVCAKNTNVSKKPVITCLISLDTVVDEPRKKNLISSVSNEILLRH